MADTSNVNNEMAMTESHVLTTSSDLIADTGSEVHDVNNVDVTDEEILQQALEEATNSNEVVQIQYSNGIGDGNIVNSVISGEEFPGELASDQSVVFENGTYTVVGGNDGQESLTYTIVEGDGDQLVYASTPVAQNDQTIYTTSEMQVAYSSGVQTMAGDSNSSSFADQDSNMSSESTTCVTIPANALSGSGTSDGQSISVNIVSKSSAKGAPLGSSQNPIRIVQQGNHYTPVQELSTDQLQQIMQVLQQQQVAKNTSDEGSSILFNPQTNTRIVYRVIYPSELHKGNTQGQQTRTVIIKEGQRRPYKKRREEEEEDKYDGPELSKEEKEERKKHRPRTRSGRISKPPKHMVKDYKHIHVLDMDEEEAADDSDGGYSDFKYSEDERDAEPSESVTEEKDDQPYYESGVGSTKPKKYRCSVCDKAYIGQAGLNRHYRLNADHGTPEEEDPAASGDGLRHNGTGNISEDSNTQDSTSSTPPTSTTTKTTNYYYRKGYRGRLPGSQASIAKRRNKLNEAVKHCSDEDLMEVVLPRLAKVITLWEFLMMKVEKGEPMRPRVDDVYREYVALTKQVQKMCKSFLQPTTEQDINTDPKKLQVTESGVAAALGLSLGTYDVKDTFSNSSKVNFVTIDAKSGKVITPQPVKRKIDVYPMSPKRPKNDASSELPPDNIGNRRSNDIQSTKNSITVVHPASVISNSRVTNSRVTISSSSENSTCIPSISSKPTIIHPSQQLTLASSSKTVVQPKSHIVTISTAIGSTVGSTNGQTISTPSTLLTTNTQSAVISYPSISSLSNITIQPASSVVNSGGISLLPANLRPSAKTIPVQVGQNTGAKPGTKVIRIVSSDVGLLNSLGSMNSNELLNMISGSNAQIPISNSSIINVQEKQSVQSSIGESQETLMVVGEGMEVTTNSEGSEVTNKEENVYSVQLSGSESLVKSIPIQHMASNGLSNSFQESNIPDMHPEDNGCESFVATDLMHVSEQEESEVGLNVVDSALLPSENEVTSEDTEVLSSIINYSRTDANTTTTNNHTQVVQFIQGASSDNQGEVIPECQMVEASNIYQTPEGMIIIHNADGSTMQLQGAEGEPIPLETVQALLSNMDSTGQILQTVDGTEAINQ